MLAAFCSLKKSMMFLAVLGFEVADFLRQVVTFSHEMQMVFQNDVGKQGQALLSAQEG